MLSKKTCLLIVVSRTISGLVPGCAQIRKATYPADFVYLTQVEVKSKMALMSLYMNQLDEILSDNASISSEQQSRIVNILVAIDENANALGAGNLETNHLIIDEHIDQFKSDVNKALFDVRSSPPNYYALGKLAGSCTACHRYRKS